MTKKVFKKINLTCVLQTPNPNFYGEVSSNDAGNGQPTVVSGILSPIDGGMLFQETLTRKRPIRNSRLYEGQHIALVRRKDGFYYPLLKALKPQELQDKPSLAFRIYCELTEALGFID